MRNGIVVRNGDDVSLHRCESGVHSGDTPWRPPQDRPQLEAFRLRFGEHGTGGRVADTGDHDHLLRLTSLGVKPGQTTGQAIGTVPGGYENADSQLGKPHWPILTC